jgi:biopolymer transport protein ExbD
MRRRTLHAPRPFTEVNATPLIDVVMCLIIFFLIVGKLTEDRRRTLDLPRSSTGVREPVAGGEGQQVVIDVQGTAQSPRVFVDQAEVTAEAGSGGLGAALRERLAGAAARAKVAQVRGSRGLPYSAIAPVISACRAAGFESVRLATEKLP